MARAIERRKPLCMKLHIVPARQGILWVKLGMRTFFRQPLALTGLFFIFMAAMSVISMVPVIGNVLALALLPGARRCAPC